MFFLVLASQTFLTAVLAMLLVREIRMRRTLEVLIANSFTSPENPTMIRIAFLIGIVVLFFKLTGCSPSDSRLADYAQWSVDQQTHQNVQQAEQNEDLLEAQRSLHQGIQQERAHLDQQHDDLEAQRREIAEQRIRAPLVAESIQSTALLLACLLPLLICAYALRAGGPKVHG